MMEEKRFREVMGHFPTGVTVVTTREEDGTPAGLTVSAFTSVSLDPIRLLVCIHRMASAHALFLPGLPFAVNVLSADQSDLAIRFASGLPEKRFSGLRVKESPLGNPLFPGVIAWLDCRVMEIYPGGDHSVILAEAVDGEATEGEPLFFFRGRLGGGQR